MNTYLDLKTSVTGQLGGLDGGTYVAKRETCINRARRRYYGEHRWYYLNIDDYTVTFTGGIGSLPANFNLKYDPIDLYFYAGNIKYVFTKVAWGSIPSYLTDQYVYAVNKHTSEIKTNHPEIISLTMEYTYIPADYTATDGSQDVLIEPAPDITAIELLSIGYWWLSKERDFTKFESFEQDYTTQLQKDLALDDDTDPVRFFRPVRPYIIRGYISKF